MPDEKATTPQPRRPLRPRHLLKGVLIAIASLIALVGVIFCVVIAYLKPQRLTPLVNRYASEYLMADVEASRVELTFFSSFPHLILQVDSLRVDSRVEGIGEDARRLLSVGCLSGAINIPALMAGRIALGDVEIQSPQVTAVALSDTIANWMIFPATTDDEPSQPATTLPDISINSFIISGDARATYRSLPDSIAVECRLASSVRSDTLGLHFYTLDISGSGAASLGSLLSLVETPFGMNGGVNWDPAKPMALTVKDMRMYVDSISATLNTTLDFADTLRVNSLDLRAPDLDIARAIALIPDTLRGELGKISTDLRADLSARLSEPFTPGVDSIPSLILDLAAKGGLSYDRLKLNDIDIALTADVRGKDLDASTIEIERMRVAGRATGLDLSGRVSRIISDPSVDMKIKGGINLGALPRQLLDRLAMTVEGRVMADANVRLRLSDLTPATFHRAHIDGNIRLNRFHSAMRDSSAAFFASGTTLRFGTSSTLPLPSGTADSLLTLSFLADTLAARLDSGRIVLASAGLRAGIGMKNIGTTFDTSRVNPIGARISADRLFFRSRPDSMSLRLNDISAGASITRLDGIDTIPRLALRLSAGRMRYVDPFNFAAMNDAEFDLAMHLRPRQERRARAETDSTSTLRKARRAQRRSADSAAIASGEAIDFGLDRSTLRTLRRLDLGGTLRVGSGRVMSRFFPMRARLGGFGMRMSADSVIIDSARLDLGRSKLALRGRVDNITRALSSVRQPLRASFTVDADALDINKLTEAAFAGADFANNIDSRPRLTEDDADEAIAQSFEAQTDTAAKSAIIVPSNVDLSFTLRARNVTYGDIRLNRLAGDIAVSNGAINLNRLAGHTDAGSINLTALYSAPSLDSLRFAAGMSIRKLRLADFLAMMPEVDSIMPLLRDISGTVNTELALTTELDDNLDLRLPTLDAVMRISGDSLRLLDSETFRTIAKWLMFKDKKSNIIDHMDVELMVRDNRLDLFPFVFDFDRYRLGVSGTNDLALTLDYHIAVLKSPLPFKFGVNIKGTPEKMRFSLGRARFNEKEVASRSMIADTTRINLLQQIEHVFRFGANAGRRNPTLTGVARPTTATTSEALTDSLVIAPADSAILIREGLLTPVP